jgi:hypothetical protein
VDEIYTAMRMSRTAYYTARREGKLATADNLLRAADHFGLDAIELLRRFGFLPPADD